VDRLGLGATGLPSLHPQAIRGWLDRVRAGGLDDAEARATTLATYRVWLVALLLKALGSGWDVAWHFKWLRDDFAPPHNVNLVGDGIAIVLVILHWYTRFAVDRTALRLMIGGATLFVASAPIDVINHRINGLDITSWSVTHFGLYTGTAILIAGVIRGWRLHSTGLPGRGFLLGALWLFFLENVFFPNEQQEYGTLAIKAYNSGHPTAEPILLDLARSQAKVAQLTPEIFRHFALPIPNWVYPLWISTAIVLTLVVARRSIGWRWTATALAAGYVGWRCVLWPLLVAVKFPPSIVPFALLLVGLAVDLVLRRELPWPVEAVVGAVVVTTAAYVGLFVQGSLITAPPVSYWSAPASALIIAVLWGAFARARATRDLILF
jgi:hypothetical protein